MRAGNLLARLRGYTDRMRTLLALTVAAAASVFLVREYRLRNLPSVPPTLAPAAAPEPLVAEEDLAGLRAQAQGSDPGLRWTALQALYALSDPSAVPALEQAMLHEPDAEARTNIVLLLKTAADPAALRVLALGARDSDPVVRAASLRIIGEVGDLSASALVAQALEDQDQGVKLAAMGALGSLEARRRVQYDELAGRLRRQYEGQLRKADGGPAPVREKAKAKTDWERAI